MEAKIDVLKAECPTPMVIEMSEDMKVNPEPYVKAKPMKEDKQKKKDVKSVEHVLKALNSLNTPEEKLAAMCKKYTEIVDENRKLQQSLKHTDKRCSAISKEKEQLQLEYNKSVLLKSKLENLCRELQKQNKSVKDESLLKIREEEERRKETQAKFQSTLSEISALMRQNNEKNTELRDANIDITKKFKSVVEQYELREQQIEKMSKQMALESQLAEAKLAKAGLEAQAERERVTAENKQLLVEIAQYQVKMQEMQGTETSLRSQVNMYTDKYDEFQNALTKSNEVFGGFKGEMEKMSKKITKLEKESLSWKKRWEVSNVALVNMVADKQKSDEQTSLLGRQLAQLQKLCRTMQAERSGLIKTLEDHNIPRPVLPLIISEPAPETQAQQPNTIDKVDEMAINCKQLKQSLAQLQGQLHALTAKHTTEEENASDPKKVKSKKNKNKKNKDKRDSPIINDDDCTCETETEIKDGGNVEIVQQDVADAKNTETKCPLPVQSLESSVDSNNSHDDKTESSFKEDVQRTSQQNNVNFVVNSDSKISCPFAVPQNSDNPINQPLGGHISIADESINETVPNSDSLKSPNDSALIIQVPNDAINENNTCTDPIIVGSLNILGNDPIKTESPDKAIETNVYERLSNMESLPILENNLDGENVQFSVKAVAISATDVSGVAAEALSSIEKS